MEELELMAAVVAGTIEDKLREMRSIDIKEKPLKHESVLGELTAYNDILNMLIWRINQLKEDK